MAKIPYQPYSTAQPIPSSGATGYRVQTSGAQFGVNVDQAIASVGQTIEGAGNEIFNRAIAIQDTRNQAEKTELDAKYMMKTNDAYVNFEAKGGEAAFGSFDAFKAQLEAERQGMADSASNDVVKRKFLADSLGTMARTNFSAGRHSAAEQKKYYVNTAQAKVDALNDTARKMKWDDHDFNVAVQQVGDEIDKMANINGPNSMPPEQVANLKGKAISELWANRIAKLGDTDPPAARRMLEENKQYMRSDAYEKTDQHIQQLDRTVTARNASDAINAGYGPWFNQNSIDKMNTVDVRLQNVVKWVHQHHPEVQFQVVSGKRSLVQQAAAVRAGHSRTMHSHHLVGGAFDAVPQAGTTYAQLEKAIKEGFSATGTPLSGEHDKISSWDPGHYSMPWNTEKPVDPNAIKMPEEPVAQRVARGQAWARQYNPQDPLLPDVMADRVRGGYQKELIDKRDALYHNTNLINQAMYGGFNPDNKMPSTEEELVASSPEVRAAWEAMDYNQRKPFYHQLAQNAGGQKGWGPGGIENYKDLYALSQSELDEDRQKFLDTDIKSVKGLSTGAAVGFIKQQIGMLHSHKDDPRSNKAMGYMEGELLQAGITRRDAPDLYLRYRADLGDAIKDFQVSHNGRPPSQSEITQIGRLLLQNVAVNAWGRQYNPEGWGHQALYNVNVPSDAYEKIHDDPIWKEEGIEPTDEMIRREYVKVLFRKLYGSKIGVMVSNPQRFRTASQ